MAEEAKVKEGDMPGVLAPKVASGRFVRRDWSAAWLRRGGGKWRREVCVKERGREVEGGESAAMPGGWSLAGCGRVGQWTRGSSRQLQREQPRDTLVVRYLETTPANSTGWKRDDGGGVAGAVLLLRMSMGWKSFRSLRGCCLELEVVDVQGWGVSGWFFSWLTSCFPMDADLIGVGWLVLPDVRRLVVFLRVKGW